MTMPFFKLHKFTMAVSWLPQIPVKVTISVVEVTSTSRIVRVELITVMKELFCSVMVVTVVLVRVLQLVIVLGVVMVVTVLSVIVDWLGQDTEKNVCTEVSDLVRVEVVLERIVRVVVIVSVEAKLEVRVSVSVTGTRVRLSSV
jgi:hypothetical protein